MITLDLQKVQKSMENKVIEWESLLAAALFYLHKSMDFLRGFCIRALERSSPLKKDKDVLDQILSREDQRIVKKICALHYKRTIEAVNK